MASVIKMLEKHPVILHEIIKQHELLDIFIENLIDGNSSTERKTISIEVFESLFSQKETVVNSRVGGEETYGHHY